MESFGTLAGSGLMMLAVIATAGVIARYNRFYRRELASPGGRELPLDGLRGLAALMVALHHAAICRVWLSTDEWGDAHSAVLQVAGPAGVILFFMLTGYLFWNKVRVGNGRMPPWKLWRGRLFRIAPMYLFSLLLVLLVAAGETGTSWLTPEHWAALLRLFALGALKWHSVGSMNPDVYNAGVVWTLWYEWGFYLVLPFIAWFATGRKIFWVALAGYVLTAAGVIFHLNLQPGAFFLLGMLCPALVESPVLRAQMQSPRIAAAALLASTLLFVMCRHYLVLAKVPTLSLAAACFPVFAAAAAGNTFFGILAHPAMRCLGAVSFSLYLLHGIFFKLMIHGLHLAGFAHVSQVAYWIFITGVACAITCLCAATFRWIEYPFVSKSHQQRMEEIRLQKA